MYRKEARREMMGSDALPQDSRPLAPSFIYTKRYAEEKYPSRKNWCLMYTYAMHSVFEVLPSASRQYIFKYLMKPRKLEATKVKQRRRTYNRYVGHFLFDTREIWKTSFLY